MNTPVLKTERLILRKFTEQDIEALFLILQDKEVNQFLPWYPLKDIDEAKRFYKERYAEEFILEFQERVSLEQIPVMPLVCMI